MQELSYKFECPHCRQRIEASVDIAGQSIDCPSCQHGFEAPVLLCEIPKAVVPAGSPKRIQIVKQQIPKPQIDRSELLNNELGNEQKASSATSRWLVGMAVGALIVLLVIALWFISSEKTSKNKGGALSSSLLQGQSVAGSQKDRGKEQLSRPEVPRTPNASFNQSGPMSFYGVEYREHDLAAIHKEIASQYSIVDGRIVEVKNVIPRSQWVESSKDVPCGDAQFIEISGKVIQILDQTKVMLDTEIPMAPPKEDFGDWYVRMSQHKEPIRYRSDMRTIVLEVRSTSEIVDGTFIKCSGQLIGAYSGAGSKIWHFKALMPLSYQEFRQYAAATKGAAFPKIRESLGKVKEGAARDAAYESGFTKYRSAAKTQTQQ